LLPQTMLLSHWSGQPHELSLEALALGAGTFERIKPPRA
jgi:hypothetical protein